LSLSLSSMNYLEFLAKREMVPVLLNALSIANPRRGADAAFALNHFIESADTEYLKREYGNIIEHLKHAITVCPRTFKDPRLLLLLHCVMLLVNAVGKEAFKEDALEILPVLCEAYPLL
ncbi:hypothetical protein PMAYCL1PPCAC_19970, partial [Pristionchus mayeri]